MTIEKKTVEITECFDDVAPALITVIPYRDGLYLKVYEDPYDALQVEILNENELDQLMKNIEEYERDKHANNN